MHLRQVKDYSQRPQTAQPPGLLHEAYGVGLLNLSGRIKSVLHIRTFHTLGTYLRQFQVSL